MVDRSIRISLDAKVTGLVNGFKTASTAAKNLNDRVVQNEQAVRDLTTGMGIVGAAGVAGAAVAIKTFANFDKTMSNVKATGEATATQLAALRDAAIDAGAKTAFSASEAAAGVENLLKAGVSAKDVLGGGLTGALDLAAAGELDVASAAEIASTAMTQFGLSGGDVTHVADLLAAGAGKAQGDVTDLAQALKQGGLVASQTGLTIEETTGTLSAFAAAGLLGSDAGTSFKTMLQRLSAPSGEAATLMKQLGINAYDAGGEFVGMEAFAGQLTTALGDMTPAQRNAALATIFGADAVRAASVVYSNGEAGIRKWIGAVDDQGYAAEVAATRLDNLQGDIEAFGGSVETAFIKAGSGGNDVMRGIVQGATDAVNAIGAIPGPILGVSTAIVGSGGLVALGVAGLGKLALSVNEIGTAWNSMGRGVKIASFGMAGALAAATVGITIWAQKTAEARAAVEEWKGTLDEFGNTTDLTLQKVNDGLSKSRDVWYQIGEDQRSAIQIADQYGVAITDVQQAILGNDGALARVRSSLEDANQQYTYGTTGAYLFQQGSERLLGTISQQREEIARSTTEKQRAAAADEAAGVAQEGLQDSYKTTTGTIDEQVASLEELISAQQEAAGIALSARESQRAYQEALDDARKSLKENGKTLDISTEKGRANQDRLDAISEAAIDMAVSMEKNGASQKKVQGIIRTGRQDYIDMATDMGLSKKEAKKLADNLGLIPGNYKADISANTAAAETAIANFLADVESVSGTITIKGDNGPIKKTLKDATAEVNESDGTVKIKGNDGQALATLSDYTATVDKSSGTVTIKGKDKQGRKTVLELTSWVGDQTPEIGVDANTKDAQKAVDDFVTLNGGREIKIGTRIVSQGMGDGEGAGWTGGTPRGVSQMTSAVQAMDPTAAITSGYRPGAITATGYPSYHGMGRAIDIVSGNMGRTFDILARAFGSRAKELYYTPRGFIRNGAWTNNVAGVTRATHYDHVHLALASGGRLPGMSPANPHEDNLLGVDEHGVPIARVRSGEWVVSQPASNYYGDGIMSALNSKRIPREAFEGLPGLARGGAVGDAEGDLKRARRALDRARKERRDAKGDKARDRAQRAVDRAEERVSNERDRLSRLRDERRDLGIDLRRRNIRESATSGLSGAYGVADEMFALARSGDLTKGQSRRLSRQAGRAERAMRGLYRQAEKLENKLGKAKDKLQDIASIKANVGSALAGEQSLAEGLQQGEFRDVVRTNSRGETYSQTIFDPGSGLTGKTLTMSATATAARLRLFSTKLRELRKRGLSGVVLEEITGLGSEQGITVADALLKQPGQIDDLNRAYKDIKRYSNAAGTQVAESFGLSAAQGLVKGLEKQEAKVEKRIEKWGVYMANGLISALGGRKKIKARAKGGPVSAGSGYLVGEEGPEFIVPQSSGYVLTAEQTRRLAATATMRSSSTASSGGPQINVRVEKIVAVDENAAVNRLVTKMQDAINAEGIGALAQGVGV